MCRLTLGASCPFPLSLSRARFSLSPSLSLHLVAQRPLPVAAIAAAAAYHDGECETQRRRRGLGATGDEIGSGSSGDEGRLRGLHTRWTGDGGTGNEEGREGKGERGKGEGGEWIWIWTKRKLPSTGAARRVSSHPLVLLFVGQRSRVRAGALCLPAGLLAQKRPVHLLRRRASWR